MKRNELTKDKLLEELQELRSRVARALKESKHQWEGTFNAICDGIAILDLDGKILRFNRSFEDIAIVPPENIRRQRCCKVLHDLDEHLSDCPIQKMIKRGKRAKCERKFSDNRWFLVTSDPIRDHKGTLLGAVHIFHDISKEKKIQEALLRKDKELSDQARSLQEANVALKVVLQHRDEERKLLEENILVNVQRMVLPYLAKIEQSTVPNEIATYVEIVRSNLEELVSPFARILSLCRAGLTPTEIRVADLIKQGKTSKEIARLSNISPSAVHVHRYNIRRKLGLLQKKINLQSYLRSIIK